MCYLCVPRLRSAYVRLLLSSLLIRCSEHLVAFPRTSRCLAMQWSSQLKALCSRKRFLSFGEKYYILWASKAKQSDFGHSGTNIGSTRRWYRRFCQGRTDGRLYKYRGQISGTNIGSQVLPGTDGWWSAGLPGIRGQMWVCMSKAKQSDFGHSGPNMVLHEQSKAKQSNAKRFRAFGPKYGPV